MQILLTVSPLAPHNGTVGGIEMTKLCRIVSIMNAISQTKHVINKSKISRNNESM